MSKARHSIPHVDSRSTFPVLENMLKRIDNEALGKLVKEYIDEANHQGTPWEGFDSRDMTGIRRFLEDLLLYHKTIEASAVLKPKKPV